MADLEGVAEPNLASLPEHMSFKSGGNWLMLHYFKEFVFKREELFLRYSKPVMYSDMLPLYGWLEAEL